ncbi:MAG: hypothetical protein V7607_2550 [Solirubrobacteraceae bacterium]
MPDSNGGESHEDEDPTDAVVADQERYRGRLWELPEVEHPKYGKVLAPEHADQTLTLLGQLAALNIGAWRGHADVTWEIDPALVRRYKRHRAWLGARYRPTEANVRAIEQALVERARSVGFGEGLGELELLARLQHHGAATRLLDCTRNAFVALWFACRELHDRDGLLIGFRLSDYGTQLTTDMLQWDIDALLKHGGGGLLWWAPRSLSPRIAAQQSVLVFGPVVTEPWGSIRLGEGTIDIGDTGNVPGVALVLVPHRLKEALNGVWADIFGFSEESLFPDFDGFHKRTPSHATSRSTSPSAASDATDDASLPQTAVRADTSRSVPLSATDRSHTFSDSRRDRRTRRRR